jgi:DNA primase
MIKRETIDKVREASDIVEVIGNYVPLKQMGKRWRGLCPFHPDKSPSFYVSPERKLYYCFGCHAGGDTISFVMKIEKLDYPEAVKLLAKRLNIEVQLEHVNLKNQALYDACEFAAQFFSRQLAKYSVAVNYLLKRGMKDETVSRFRLGYAPGGNALREEAGRQGLKEEVLLKAGLIAQRERGISDYFFARVVCPITSVSGRVIGFSGRVLDDSEPKYLNSPETDIFRKGDGLFGLFQAKSYLRESAPLLVEGNFDLLALANRGINHVVAPLGTAFTFEQALLLKRYNSQVRVLFDGDQAGRNATRRALDILLKAGLDPAVVLLPDDYDPDDYIREFGKEKLLELTSQPVDAVAFMLRLRQPKSIAEKNAVLREILQLVALIPDAMVRELYVNRVAESFQVAKDLLLARVAQTPTNDGRPGTEDGRTPPVSGLRSPVPMTQEERLLALATARPVLVAAARRLLPPETFGDSILREIASKLYEESGEDDAALGHLIERLPDEAQRARVAGWEFQNLQDPTEKEYVEGLKHARVKYLCRAIRTAQESGDSVTADKLTAELNGLEFRSGPAKD